MRARHLPIQLAVVSLMLLVACTESTPPPSRTVADRIEIMYLANEGFLLTSGDHKVLIDGLFREGGDYANLPLEWRETVETAQPPFDTVDVVLATHHHADHFHALAVCRFLDSNPLAEFVSTRQALDQMRSACDNPAALAGRVQAGLLSDGSSATVVLDELRIESVFLHHGAASPVENIGFLIEIGGLTVLHMGDSQATAEDLRAAGLGERSIDLAFVPYWYLIDKRWTPAIELLQPGGIVVMHIPPPGSPLLESFQGWDALVRTIINRFQQAVVFAEPFETRTY
ncbi:MAG: MBL fold metallo-hydrolase [Acidobacteria bacterium]|nr:MBL fold metallo-hydrolase [Acidobacteriota bacterium]